MVSSASAQASVERHAIAYYNNNGCDAGSVRSGLSDAAHMIDAIAKNIVFECCPGRRKPRKDIMQVLRCLNRAAEAIWAMREKIPNANEYSEKKD